MNRDPYTDALPGRRCERTGCTNLLPADARPDRTTCSSACRQAKYREQRAIKRRELGTVINAKRRLDP